MPGGIDVFDRLTALFGDPDPSCAAALFAAIGDDAPMLGVPSSEGLDGPPHFIETLRAAGEEADTAMHSLIAADARTQMALGEYVAKNAVLRDWAVSLARQVRATWIALEPNIRHPAVSREFSSFFVAKAAEAEQVFREAESNNRLFEAALRSLAHEYRAGC